MSAATCGCTCRCAQPPEWERAEDEPGLISREAARRAYEAVDRTWFQSAERKAIDDHLRSVAKDGRAARAVARVQFHHDRTERGSQARYLRAIRDCIWRWEVEVDSAAREVAFCRNGIATRRWRASAVAEDLRLATVRLVARSNAVRRAKAILARLESR